MATSGNSIAVGGSTTYIGSALDPPPSAIMGVILDSTSEVSFTWFQAIQNAGVPMLGVESFDSCAFVKVGGEMLVLGINSDISMFVFFDANTGVSRGTFYSNEVITISHDLLQLRPDILIVPVSL